MAAIVSVTPATPTATGTAQEVVEGGVGEKEAAADTAAGEAETETAEASSTSREAGQILEGSSAESRGPAEMPTSGAGGTNRSLRILAVTLLALAVVVVYASVGSASRKRDA
ncbi:MAG: hypothetical protein ACK2UO_09220 [Caldilineaceae bacterium]